MKYNWRITLLVAAALLAATAILVRYQTMERRTAMMRADPDTILAGEGRLRGAALKRGRAVFLEHCAACHGDDAKGDAAIAMPNLTDGIFLYGQNKPSEIEQIVLHGIRAGDSRGWNLAEMPAFARRVPYRREPLPSLRPAQISSLVAFLRAANGAGDYTREQIDRGRTLFLGAAGCWDCHGGDAGGDPSIGAPNLVDGEWLKGDGSEAAIRDVLEHGLAGVSPAFKHILPAYDARSVAVYTASLHTPVTGE